MGDMLTAVMQRLEALERNFSPIQQPQELSLQPVNFAAPVKDLKTAPKEHVAVNESLTMEESPVSGAIPLPREPQADWLRVGELCKELKRRGYKKSDVTIRRLVNTAAAAGELPTELIELGVEADFKSRSEAKLQDNTVRWLRLTR